MATDILAYPPLQQSDPFAPPTHHERYPEAQVLREIYRTTGYPETQQGQATMTAIMRGSTAAYFDGKALNFRHPKSDIDIVAVTGDAGPSGAQYLFYNVPTATQLRELDVLCFTPARLHAEERDPYRVFLVTKLIQPGVPILAAEAYEAYKIIAIATLMVQGAARQGRTRITPSGGARLMLEEDLFAEPWRWQSLRTYYITSPTATHQRHLLTYFSHRALKRLEQVGIAREVSHEYQNPAEPVYSLDTSHIRYTHPFLDRLRTIYWFVYDQFRVLFHSDTSSFNVDNGIRVFLKFASLIHNPTLRYDADLVFG